VGKTELREHESLWTPLSTSMKINTCLGSQHLHGAWVTDAADFHGSSVINRRVYRQVFKFFSVR